MQLGAASNAVQAEGQREAAETSAKPQPVPALEADSAPAVAVQEDTPEAYGKYLATLALLVLVALGSVAFANRLMSPWVHMPETKVEIAEILLDGDTFGFFDLNIDIRGIRRAQIANMERTPDLIVLGASHWQEAHAGLYPGTGYFNGHVHRDYYDDHMAMVELLVQHDRLPPTLAITIRDSTFAAPQNRTDFLWLPFIPEFRMMEARLGLPKRPWYRDIFAQPVIDLFSLPTAIFSVKQLLTNEERPGPRIVPQAESLDVLMPDGSIRWSLQHEASFTPERSRALATGMANDLSPRAPDIDPLAVESIERLLALLQQKGVEVILVNPPFNPIFFDAVADTPYGEGLEEVRALTHRLAKTYGAAVAGSFNPRNVGCNSAMYIDSEHSNPDCLGRLLRQIHAQVRK